MSAEISVHEQLRLHGSPFALLRAFCRACRLSRMFAIFLRLLSRLRHFVSLPDGNWKNTVCTTMSFCGYGLSTAQEVFSYIKYILLCTAINILQYSTVCSLRRCSLAEKLAKSCPCQARRSVLDTDGIGCYFLDAASRQAPDSASMQADGGRVEGGGNVGERHGWRCLRYPSAPLMRKRPHRSIFLAALR